MQKFLLLIITCFVFSLPGQAQFSRYIIQFKDKGSNPFSLSNPLQFLSQRALDRRTRYNIPIDSTDLPITPRYIDSLRLAGDVTIINVSKWLNQVAIKTNDDAALEKIYNLPFVINHYPIAARFTSGNNYNKELDPPTPPNNVPPVNNFTQNPNDFYDYGQSAGQVKIHNADFLHNHGFRGENMQMAVLDAGFLHYLTLPTFDSVRNNGQILGTWDFVANEASVDEDYYHGMQCFSTIAANMPGTFVGTAPKTAFYLFRTEDVNSEYPIEEQNWAAGVERADSLGVDITSTSLGYSRFTNAQFDYTYANMDGNTTISAKAADVAAKKGMLVVTAAGNEGNSSWHYLITPSDADSSLSVGAVDVNSNVASFSSYGPSGDGQVKPAVAAVGWNAVVANTSNGMPTFNSGTSFACPNMAGVTTCLWQAFPEINNMGIIEALQASATRSSDPDDRIGYGIPDAKKAFVMLQKRLYTKNNSFSNCKVQFRFSVKTDNTMNIEVERKGPGEADYNLLPGNMHNDGIFAQHDFSFADDLSNASLGSYAYRLRMIIGTDTSFYLDEFSVDYMQSCAPPAQNSIAIGPNPVSDQLNVIIGRIDESKIEVLMQNSIGQKVYRSSFQQSPGISTRPIPMQSLSKGVYFITVYINNKKETTRKIIKR